MGYKGKKQPPTSGAVRAVRNRHSKNKSGALSPKAKSGNGIPTPRSNPALSSLVRSYNSLIQFAATFSAIQLPTETEITEQWNENDPGAVPTPFRLVAKVPMGLYEHGAEGEYSRCDTWGKFSYVKSASFYIENYLESPIKLFGQVRVGSSHDSRLATGLITMLEIVIKPFEKKLIHVPRINVKSGKTHTFFDGEPNYLFEYANIFEFIITRPSNSAQGNLLDPDTPICSINSGPIVQNSANILKNSVKGIKLESVAVSANGFDDEEIVHDAHFANFINYPDYHYAGEPDAYERLNKLAINNSSGRSEDYYHQVMASEYGEEKAIKFEADPHHNITPLYTYGHTGQRAPTRFEGMYEDDSYFALIPGLNFDTWTRSIEPWDRVPFHSFGHNITSVAKWNDSVNMWCLWNAIQGQFFEPTEVDSTLAELQDFNMSIPASTPFLLYKIKPHDRAVRGSKHKLLKACNPRFYQTTAGSEAIGDDCYLFLLEGLINEGQRPMMRNDNLKGFWDSAATIFTTALPFFFLL
jgi:hypothetical protein